MSTTTTEKLFHQLHRCMNLLHRGHDHQHGRCGGDAHRGQGRIVSLLRQQDGLSQKELAEMLHIRPPSLSEVLDKLEANGLIERRQHEADKRMSNVFITEKGHEAAAQVETARQNAADTLLAGLSQEEQETLSTLLDKLVGTLETNLGANPEDAASSACRGHHNGKHHHGHHGEGHGAESCEGHGHHGHTGHHGEGHGQCHGHHSHPGHHKHHHGEGHPHGEHGDRKSCCGHGGHGEHGRHEEGHGHPGHGEHGEHGKHHGCCGHEGHGHSGHNGHHGEGHGHKGHHGLQMNHGEHHGHGEGHGEGKCCGRHGENHPEKKD